MNQYLAFFKIKFMATLQYRTSAIAGIFTQLFFGFIYVMIYQAFYDSNTNTYPMAFTNLINYLWLNQAFFSLTYPFYKDKEILNSILTGNVSYELCRPGYIYFRWFSKILATKTSTCILRFLPILIVSPLLPPPINLSMPTNLFMFFLFLFSLLITSFLITSMITLIHFLSFYFIHSLGVITFYSVIVELFAGMIIPIAFFPKTLKIISDFLPFKYIIDLSFKLYNNELIKNEAFKQISIQLIWTGLIIFIGFLISKKITKKVIIQGG